MGGGGSVESGDVVLVSTAFSLKISTFVKAIWTPGQGVAFGARNTKDGERER